MVSVAVAVSSWDVGAPALIDGAGSVADSASVIVSDTVVDVVADPVSVDVCCAISSADAQGIELVSVAVAVSGGNVGAPALIDGAGSVADSASVIVSDTVVDVVADPVSVAVCCAVSSADAEGIELVSVAVAVSGRDVGAPALIDGAGSVADSAGIVVSDAVVDVVADPVSV